MVRISLFFCFLSFCLTSAMSQEGWTLQQCIDQAVKNNLDLMQSNLDVQSRAINLENAKAARWPNLNASTSYYTSFGRRIDPTTNSFNSQQFGNQQYNIGSDVTLFNFNRIQNTIRQSNKDLEAATADRQQLENDIALNVAQVFLTVLLAKEDLEVARKSRDQTESQLELIDKLISAGSRSRNSRLEIVAQIAQNDAQIIAAENNIATGLLNLKQLMLVDPATQLDIVSPKVELPIENPDQIQFEEVVTQAINNQPRFKASDLRIQSALLGEKTAQAQGLPSLSLSGSMGTNYSTLNQRVTGFEPLTNTLPNVRINGEPATVSYQSISPLTANNPYLKQLNENIGYGIGLGIRIPIYNNNQVHSAVQLAKINTESLNIRDKQLRQTIRTDVMRALTDAKAAKRTYEASMRSYETLQAAFSDTQKRFEIGNTNTFELITARNNLDNSNRNVLINKYDYVFKMKILEFYAGKITGF